MWVGRELNLLHFSLEFYGQALPFHISYIYLFSLNNNDVSVFNKCVMRKRPTKKNKKYSLNKDHKTTSEKVKLSVIFSGISYIKKKYLYIFKDNREKSLLDKQTNKKPKHTQDDQKILKKPLVLKIRS